MIGLHRRSFQGWKLKTISSLERLKCILTLSGTSQINLGSEKLKVGKTVLKLLCLRYQRLTFLKRLFDFPFEFTNLISIKSL